MAKAHFEIKDFESCLLFLDVILTEKKSYQALTLKYKSLIKLNKKKES